MLEMILQGLIMFLTLIIAVIFIFGGVKLVDLIIEIWRKK